MMSIMIICDNNDNDNVIIFFSNTFLACFAYVPRFVILRDVWIRTQRAAVATHLHCDNVNDLLIILTI